jgi:RimJ/RimL family protein N-acetyltransferase
MPKQPQERHFQGDIPVDCKTPGVHHFDVVPRLTDGVVVLDAHSADDIAQHVAGEDEEIARRFGWWPQRSDPVSVERAYKEWSDDWELQRERRAFAVHAADGRLIGGCELRLQPDGVTGHVSYWTHADERDRGYSQRALGLLVAFAGTLGLSRLEAHIAPDNLASRHVSEAVGFAPETRFTDENGEAMIRYGRTIKDA